VNKELQMTAKSNKPSIVFVHGLWADGSCFSKLIPTLQAEGHEVIAAQYGLDSDGTETSQSLLDKFPKTEVFSKLELVDGRVWLKPEGIDRFAGDLSPEQQKLIWATHAAPAADLLNQKADGVAWRAKPSWYVVATQDRTVHPELQRFLAKRMDARTREVHSSHVPMLSQPGLVLDVIRQAVETVARG
jgi:pimeloyl-ACP methyl ester carboxylesterase